MLSRNTITLKRIQSVETPTGSKDALVTLFKAYADIKKYSAKELQRLGIDLKNSTYTIQIRYSKSRSIQIGDKLETLEGELIVNSWTIDGMGQEKYFTITASKNGL